MKIKKITTKPDRGESKITIGGWLQGKDTYLWIGDKEKGDCLGVISGYKLYRLAKAIVRHFEKQS